MQVYKITPVHQSSNQKSSLSHMTGRANQLSDITNSSAQNGQKTQVGCPICFEILWLNYKAIDYIVCSYIL